jgi:HAD superfamily hydrolase (TIGR01509 family)
LVTQEDVINVKPDPEGFILAMKNFGIKSQDTIIFEDSLVGIEAAKKSGANYFIVSGYS